MLITETIPLDATDAERATIEQDVAALVADLKAAGMDPVVDIETTSGGDVFIVEVGDDIAALPIDPTA
jgi:hypothetical protein